MRVITIKSQFWSVFRAITNILGLLTVHITMFRASHRPFPSVRSVTLLWCPLNDLTNLKIFLQRCSVEHTYERRIFQWMGKQCLLVLWPLLEAVYVHPADHSFETHWSPSRFECQRPGRLEVVVCLGSSTTWFTILLALPFSDRAISKPFTIFNCS